jgi:hypothetical protein
VITLFAEGGKADYRHIDKGHGRIEERLIRTSTEVVGYSTFPGLAQVAEITTRITRCSTGELTTKVHYLVTSLPPDRAGPKDLLALLRGPWRSENCLFHVADDSFGEDRQVLQTHRAGCALSLVRAAALNMLRGHSEAWDDEEPLTGRAQYLNAQPLTALSRL